MQNDTQILSAKQEFFTILPSGESGISIRGLSRMSGIPQKTLSRWFESDLTNKSVPEPLKALTGQENPVSHKSVPEPLKALTGQENPVSHLYLSCEVKVRNNPIKPIRSDVAAAVIEYAAIDLQKPEARIALKSFISIGLNSFIQGETGYLPAEFQAATLDPRHEIRRLVKEPNPWKRLYSANMCERIRSWYFPKNFFWKFAYSWMTAKEVAFLNEHNPVIPGIWQRQERIFQHLSEATRDRLAPEIAALCTIVETSTSRQDFETRWARIHGADQQEFIHV